jgi:homoaconitate hydratase
MGQTVVEKIAQKHMAEGPGRRPLRAGDFLTVRPRHVLTHDNTAPVMKKFRALGAREIADPSQPVFVLDHDIQNTSDENLAKYAAIEQFAGEQSVDFYPAGTGIGHQVMVEQQYVVPSAFVVASDSHANMYGGVGALGTPVVRTDAAAIWATGTFWWQIPRTVQVVLEGELVRGASGKDVILALCGLYNQGEVLNAAIEFSGPGVATLSMEERLAIANMTTEWGALVGWFPPDRTTLAYLRQRRNLLAGLGIERVRDEDLRAWEEDPLGPDDDAVHAGRIVLDLSEVIPHVAGPDTVQVATPLPEMEKQGIQVHKAYLVSCVNSRAEDIAAAAAVLEGRRVAAGVELYIAAASREVQEESEVNGTWQKLIEAGAQPLPPGCGPCIGLGTGLLEAGEVGISATNRNFKGRMGSRDARCYLASPAVVAASAAAGFIRGPQAVNGQRLTHRFEAFETTATGASATPGESPGDEHDESDERDESVEILPGFPERLMGRLILVPPDNLNTDGIYGKDYTYRDDMTPEAMARAVFENYDPDLAGVARPGDVIVGGWNFGTGSSREQAVTALQAAGIALVVAGSFSQTYLRNAFNNGFLCVACPDLASWLRELAAERIEAGERTIIPGDDVEIDFATGSMAYRDRTFHFAPLGAVPQGLVIAGGIENQVRQQLGIE